MTDSEARVMSLLENHQREDMEVWEKIDAVGESYALLKDSDPKVRIKLLEKQFSIKAATIVKYSQIHALPNDIKLFIKPYEHRSPNEKNKIDNNPKLTKGHILKINSAWAIARNLSSFSKEIMIDAAYFFLGKKAKDCEKIAKIKEGEPDRSWESIYDDIKSKKEGYREVKFHLSLANKRKLDENCVKRSIFYTDLLRRIVQEWLEENSM